MSSNPGSGDSELLLTTSQRRGLRSFPFAFWMLNTMEMWERLAYYGMRLVVPIYIMQADEPGGLHFTAVEKGTIYAGWAFMQSLLPMFTGGYADRYGYKNTIFVSITIKIIGYVLMATQRDFSGFFVGALTLAAGTAIFKPGIQGTIAQTLKKENSSFGWSLFYQCVNIGSFIGPFLAHYLKGFGWDMVFYGCAGIVSLNYLMLFTYKELPSGASTTEGFIRVFERTIVNIFDRRLISLILILSGFWMMMYQVWDLGPNYIVDWVDSSAIVDDLSVLPEVIRTRMIQETDRGLQVSQEQMLNLNAFMIILFVSGIGYAVGNMRRLTCMLGGIVCATFGVLIAGTANVGYVFLVGVAFFSFGEMLTGPKKNEYFALIAPDGKKGLYLGYVNIPIAIGSGIGSIIAGLFYGRYGEKAVLAQKYIAEHTDFGIAQAWDGSFGTLEETIGVGRTEAFAKLQELIGSNPVDATQLLWDTYHPQYVWIPFAVVGLVSAFAMFIFSRMSRRWADMDV